MGKNNIDLFGHDRGIGDTISRAINIMSRGHIKECDKCQERKTYLNKIVPFRNPKTGKYK